MASFKCTFRLTILTAKIKICLAKNIDVIRTSLFNYCCALGKNKLRNELNMFLPNNLK